MIECWKELQFTGKKYLVSNTGRIKSLDEYVPCKNGAIRLKKGKELKQFTNERGYKCVMVTIEPRVCKIKKVHRMVAMAFLPNENNYPQVNHIDCNKANNNVDNLEWCTNSHNMKEAYRNGLKMGRRCMYNV